MTREEAISWLKEFKWHEGEDVPIYETDIEAINMAIKALEQEPILEKLRAEIKQLPTSTCTETFRISIDADNFKKNVLEIIGKYKAEIDPQESEET